MTDKVDTGNAFPVVFKGLIELEMGIRKIIHSTFSHWAGGRSK